MRRVIRSLAALSSIALLATCSSPGSSLKINGDYLGTLQGTPRVQIHLTVSGNTITGTGTLIDVAPHVWRGDPAHAIHVVFAGTRDGRQVTSLASTESHLQFDMNLDENNRDWQDTQATFNLAFQALFNNSGGITGNWQGASFLFGNPLGGTWSVIKEGAAAGGLLRP